MNFNANLDSQTFKPAKPEKCYKALKFINKKKNFLNLYF